MTYGELLDQATKCQSEQEAAVFVEKEARRLEQVHGIPYETAKSNTIHNIRYMSGYCSDDTAQRMRSLFH
jgi:hypothetical protein